MYLAFYGLDRKPFQISADPEFLWLGPKHKEGLAILVYGVSDNKGFLVMSGGVGTGKTTLIHALLKQLDDSVVVASVSDPGLELIEFYRFIAASFGMKGKYSSKVDFLFEFEDFLKKMHAKGRVVLLIIDEAQRLSSSMLEEIRLLSNIELPEQKLLNIFFVGQEEFYNLIASPRNRALKQRITINYHLKTLSFEETCMLIDYRLKVAGAIRPIFEKEALERIHFHSQGHPRQINIICDHALLTGFVDNRPTIGADIIEECAIELMLPGEGRVPQDRPATSVADSSAAVKTPPIATNPTAPAILGEAILDAPPPPPPSQYTRERIFTVVTALLVTILAAFAYFGPQRLKVPFSSEKELIAVTPEGEQNSVGEKTPSPPPPVSSKPSTAAGMPQEAGENLPAMPARMSSDEMSSDAKGSNPDEVSPVSIENDTGKPSTRPNRQTPMDSATPPAISVEAVRPATIAREASGAQLEIPANALSGEADRDPEAVGVTAASPASIRDDSAPVRAIPEDQPPSESAAPPATFDDKVEVIEAATEKQPFVSSDLETSTATPAEKDTPDSAPLLSAQETPRVIPPPSNQAEEAAPSSAELESSIAPGPVAILPRSAPSNERPVVAERADRVVISESIAVVPDAPPTAEATHRLSSGLEQTQPEPSTPGSKDNIDAGQQTPQYALAAPAAPSSLEEDRGPNTAERLKRFLQTYCRAYSTKDLDRFRALFTADAVERNQPFGELIPVYRSNFEKLNEINYQIDLRSFTENADGSEVSMRGVFQLAYRMGGTDWKSSSGQIEMTLVNMNNEYRVKRLDYKKN